MLASEAPSTQRTKGQVVPSHAGASYGTRTPAPCVAALLMTSSLPWEDASGLDILTLSQWLEPSPVEIGNTENCLQHLSNLWDHLEPVSCAAQGEAHTLPPASISSHRALPLPSGHPPQLDQGLQGLGSRREQHRGAPT